MCLKLFLGYIRMALLKFIRAIALFSNRSEWLFGYFYIQTQLYDLIFNNQVHSCFHWYCSSAVCGRIDWYWTLYGPLSEQLSKNTLTLFSSSSAQAITTIFHLCSEQIAKTIDTVLHVYSAYSLDKKRSKQLIVMETDVPLRGRTLPGMSNIFNCELH